MVFPEIFDALKDVGRINIGINLKVRVLMMCGFVDKLFGNVRTCLANYLASPLGRL